LDRCALVHVLRLRHHVGDARLALLLLVNGVLLLGPVDLNGNAPVGSN
jgi:hypothetical protein